jgi:hypothetical protein
MPDVLPIPALAPACLDYYFITGIHFFFCIHIYTAPPSQSHPQVRGVTYRAATLGQRLQAARPASMEVIVYYS